MLGICCLSVSAVTPRSNCRNLALLAEGNGCTLYVSHGRELISCIICRPPHHQRGGRGLQKKQMQVDQPSSWNDLSLLMQPSPY